MPVEKADRYIFSREKFGGGPPGKIKASAELPEDVQRGLQDGSLIMSIAGIAFEENEILELEDKVETLRGVFDLPLVGAERLDVEHLFQQETEGPEITLTCLDGAFVEAPDNGDIWQLQERYDSPEMCKIQAEAVEKMRAAGVTRDLKPREPRQPYDHPSNYFPAGGLPTDSVLVVRTTALTEFQARLSNIEDEDEAARDIATVAEYEKSFPKSANGNDTEDDLQRARQEALSPDFKWWFQRPAVSIVGMVLLSLKIDPAYKKLSSKWMNAFALQGNGHKPFPRHELESMERLLGSLIYEALERFSTCSDWACIKEAGTLLTYSDNKLTEITARGYFGGRFCDTFVRPREFAAFCASLGWEIPNALVALVPPAQEAGETDVHARAPEQTQMEPEVQSERKANEITTLKRRLKTHQKMILAMAIERYGWDPRSTQPQKATGEKGNSITTHVERVFSKGVDAGTIKKALESALESLCEELKNQYRRRE